MKQSTAKKCPACGGRVNGNKYDKCFLCRQAEKQAKKAEESKARHFAPTALQKKFGLERETRCHTKGCNNLTSGNYWCIECREKRKETYGARTDGMWIY